MTGVAVDAELAVFALLVCLMVGVVIGWSLGRPQREVETDGGTVTESADADDGETFRDRGRRLRERQEDDALLGELEDVERAIWSAESEVPPDADDEIRELLEDAERVVVLATKIREKDVAVEHVLDP